MYGVHKTNLKTKKSKLSTLGYLAGSTVLFAVATVIIPDVIMSIAGSINKHSAKTANMRRSDDDWGSIIERKK